MVRLKREIEGVRRHHAVPLPSYALDPQASALILPGLDEWIRTREPGRVLLAGAPRTDLAVDLAREGHWVTLCDLDAPRIAALHAGLAPKIAGRLTLVDRPYGEANFGASSFDLVVLMDALHMYREPQWLLHKAQRELKPDALLALRLLVQGPTGQVTTASSAPVPVSAARALAERAAGHVLNEVERLLCSPAAPLLAGPAAREAIERGAHLQDSRFAARADETLKTVESLLHIEQLRVGHTLRLRLCDVLYGLRPALRGLVTSALAGVTEESGELDRLRTGPRVLGVVGRRGLALRTPS